MVLNNVRKFHKILIKSIRLRERTSLGQTYVCKVRTDGRTGVTLNAPAIVMAGAKNQIKSLWATEWQNQQNDIKIQSRLRSAWRYIVSEQSL